MRLSARKCKHFIRTSLKAHVVILGFVILCYAYVHRLIALKSDVTRQLNFIQVKLAIGEFGNVIYQAQSDENQTSHSHVPKSYFDLHRAIRSVPNKTKSFIDNGQTIGVEVEHSNYTLGDYTGVDYVGDSDDIVNDITIVESVKEYLYEDEEHSKTKSTKSKDKWLAYRRMVERQIKLYKQPVIKRTIKADAFYLSAIASEEGNSRSKMIKINGWQGPSYKSGPLYCCANGFEGQEQYSVLAKRVRWTTIEISVVNAEKFVCNMSKASVPFKHFPTAIGLNRSPLCKDTQYIPVEHAVNPSNKTITQFAVCAKVIYGSIDADDLFEWFEVKRRMGVDRVHLFTYNVTDKVKTLLEFYKKEGFLTTKAFDFPLKMRYPRYLGQKYVMSYIDEQVTVYDCVERHKHYDTVALIDVDEVIVPYRMNVNYTQLMSNLKSQYQQSAGYMMQTRLFVLDWQPFYPNADFRFGRYVKRTRSMWDRCKNIFMPSRVNLDTVWTHGYTPLKGYRMSRVSYLKASLYHYRNCRAHWYTQNTCLENRLRIPDLTLKKYIGRFRDSLLERRKLIFTDKR